MRITRVPKTKNKINARDARIIFMYKSWIVMRTIAKTYWITFQRVQQILARNWIRYVKKPKDPDYNKRRCREYYYKNKEVARMKAKIYYQENRKQRDEYSRKWRENNREKFNARHRKYRKNLSIKKS